MSKSSKIKTDVNIANEHADSLKKNNLSFKSDAEFIYSNSSAAEQLTDILNDLKSVTSDFSDLTVQDSNDVKKVAQLNKDFDEKQAKNWNQ